MFSRSAPYILLLSFLYGSTLVISRFSVGQYDPRVYISLRLSLAAVAYAVVYWTSTWGGRPKRLWPRDRSVLLHAAILGIIGTAIPMTSIVSSLQYQSTGVTSMLLTLNPAITVVLAQIFLADEPMTWRKTAGVIVALVGAAFLLLQGETGLADFAQALTGDAPRTRADVELALTALRALDDPSLAGIAEPQEYVRVESLRQRVSTARDTAMAEVGGALAVDVGFNAADGD